MCTNVHNHFGWWASRPTRSTARELCSLDLAPVDRAVDRQRASALCIQASVDRVVDRGTTVGNPTIGGRRPVDRQQDFLLSWTPTVIFFRPINWGCFGLFSIRFEESFWASFFYSYQWFYPHILEPIFSNQKESLSRVFKSDFLSFSPPIQS